MIAEHGNGHMLHVAFAALNNVAVAWEGIPQILHTALRLIVWLS